jgi:hypothetical protein
MWGQDVLAAEFDALGFRIDPAPRRALGDAAAFKLRCDAEHGKDKLGKIGRCIDNRLGNRTQARTARCISREAVNSPGYDNITGREGCA